MLENKQDYEKQFSDAHEDSWWLCKSPGCNCAFQKLECPETGVCPYCEGEAYNSQPWDSALLNNPHLPEVPQSGQPYTPQVV